MKKNRLGQSELWVSEIGLGCMSLGTEAKKAEAIIHEALDRGVTLLDTADLYDAGRNEEVVGQALRGRRGDVVLATKVGNRRIPGKEGWAWDPSKAYILEAVKDSLRRLQTDYIDLYQLHGGTIDDPIDETIEAFEQLRREGVIREYGISSIRPNVIREYAKRSNIVSVMSQYSLLDRRPEEEILPYLKDQGISVIARGPVARGILAEGGESKAGNGYLDYSAEELLERLPLYRAAVGEQRNPAQTAIRYSLSHPAVAAAIPGASSLEQLKVNLMAAARPELTEQERDALQRITRANHYTQHR